MDLMMKGEVPLLNDENEYDIERVLNYYKPYMRRPFQDNFNEQMRAKAKYFLEKVIGEIDFEKVKEVETKKGKLIAGEYIEFALNYSIGLADEILDLCERIESVDEGFTYNSFEILYQRIEKISEKSGENIENVVENLKYYFENIDSDFISNHEEVKGKRGSLFAINKRGLISEESFERQKISLNKGNSFGLGYSRYHYSDIISFGALVHTLDGDVNYIKNLEKEIEINSDGRMGLLIDRDLSGSASEFTVYVLPNEKKPISQEILDGLDHGPFVGSFFLTEAKINEKKYISVEMMQTDLLRREVRKKLRSCIRDYYTKGKTNWPNFSLDVIEKTAKNLGFNGVIIPHINTRVRTMKRYREFFRHASSEEKKNDYLFRLYTDIPKKKGFQLKKVDINYPLRTVNVQSSSSEHVTEQFSGEFWIK